MARGDPDNLGERLRASARNALELVRFGRLGEEVASPFDVVEHGTHHRLRRYAGAPADAPVVVLVPPLMLTADVYDIAPDISAVSALTAQGVAPWVVDFGAPEREQGGMSRSLDDHVRAVVRAIARARDLTGRAVHLGGYSQGGMFAYQAAAYLRGEGIASLVTFGSPVDIHKNLPAIRSDVAGAVVRSLFPYADAVFARIEGLPGKLTSTAFKVVSTRKELQQRIEFVRMLHDRERIMKREARRRFLGGAGFVAWPGPAFRAFVEDFVVHNRMLSGGFVIDGRSVSLADLRCPILAFIGGSDDMARPATVRAITRAAPDADVRFVTVPAGHFGIVVGSRAMTTTWPAVARWIHAIEGGASAAEALPQPEGEPAVDSSLRPAAGADRLDSSLRPAAGADRLDSSLRPAAGADRLDSSLRPAAGADRLDSSLRPAAGAGDFEVEIDLFVDVLRRATKSAWRRLGDALASASATADTVRWREPRLRRLARMEPETLVSASRELAQRAKETPDATFFLWRGRAFSYAEADRRVTNVARGLHACGVRPGERVGVLMGSRPSLLTAVAALGRIGAVPVISAPDAPEPGLAAAFERLGVGRVIVDPEGTAKAGLRTTVLVLGGGGRAPGASGAPLGGPWIDMEAIDPEAVPLPADLPLDPGQARDVAQILLRPAERDDVLRAVPITHHRWALSAIGAAGACAINPGDTVFCPVPLHHPTGMLVSAGSALAGGARLALFPPLRDPRGLLVEIRRVGATVVFYTGEMLRTLLEVPVSPADRHLPVRIFAGSGMRVELARRLRERFGVDTMEFYAGTAHRAILADAAGRAPGALGDVLPGSSDVALVRCDLARGERITDGAGRLAFAATNEPGLLAARVTDAEIETLGDTRGLVHDAFGDGTAWLVTADVLRRDASGVHWFVDALGGFVETPDGPVSTRAVEDALYTLPEVALAAAWGDGGLIVAAYASREPIASPRLAEALATLPRHARPETVARVPELPLTEGFRPDRRRAAKAAARAAERSRRDGEAYRSVT